MALDLSLLPDAPEMPEAKANPPVKTEPTPGGLDLSLLPDQPETPPEKTPTEPLTLSKVVQPIIDTTKMAATKMADITSKVPGADTLSFLQDLYGPKAVPLIPVTKGMEAAKNLTVKVGGLFDIRPPFMHQETIQPEAVPPMIPDQKAFEERKKWETDINALVESQGLDLAKTLAGKRHPDLAAAQRGQKFMQTLSDVGRIAVEFMGTGMVTEPIAQLPEIAKIISESPRLANIVESGVVGLTHATVSDMAKLGNKTVGDAFATYPQDVAQNVLGFMAFSAGAQLAGQAYDAALYSGAVEKLPVRMMVLNRDNVSRYYSMSQQDPRIRAFDTMVPGFRELAAKAYKDDTEMLLTVPDTTVTTIGAKPWYQNLRKALITDSDPIPTKSFFKYAGEATAHPLTDTEGAYQIPPERGLPSPVEPVPAAPGAAPMPKTALDLNLLPDKPSTIDLAGAPQAPGGVPSPTVSVIPQEPVKTQIQGQNAYDVLAAHGKVSDNFIFPQDSGVETLRQKTHKGEKVYVPSEIENQVQKDYVSKDLGLLKKEFADTVQRKADQKPLRETPTVFLDFDNLKELNNKLGRTQANQLFHGFTRLMNEYGFAGYRWGGDEFAIIMNPIIKGQVNPQEMLKRLQAFQTDLSKLEVRDQVSKKVIHTGVSVSGGFGMNVAEADAAAEVAKKAGKGQIILDKSFQERYKTGEAPSYEPSKTDLTARPGEEIPQQKGPENRGLAGQPSPGAPQLSGTQRPAERSASPSEITPPFEKASPSPSRPPGPGWEADAGSMPGEPHLTYKNKGAIIEHVDDRGYSTYEAVQKGGKIIGRFPSEKQAQIAVEDFFNKEPASKPGFEPTASYTPLLQDIVPQVKKAAGETDILKFVKQMGKIKVTKENSGELENFRGMGLLNEKKGRDLGDILEGAIEVGYLPPGSGENELIEMMSKQVISGKKQYPKLGGSDMIEPRPVSTLDDGQLEQAIQDFDALKAKRPLTEVEKEVLSELYTTRTQRAEFHIDLSKLPDQPDEAPLDIKAKGGILKEGAVLPGEAGHEGAGRGIEKGGIPKSGKVGREGPQGPGNIPAKNNEKGGLEKPGPRPDYFRDRPSTPLTNQEIEALVQSKAPGDFSEEEKLQIAQYTGAGGQAKQGAEGRGLLDEYYTPRAIVNRVWEMVQKYLPTQPLNILEPSVGSGGFLPGAPADAAILGFEINPTSAKIAKILFPDVTIENKPFESNFITDRGIKRDLLPPDTIDLVIGNPPYGQHRGFYKGVGEEPKILSYEEYFIKRSLDAVKDGGIVALVVPSSFLRGDSVNDYAKNEIAKIGDLVEAVRLPNNSFERTGIGTDILIFKKQPGVLMDLNNDFYFKTLPNNILGVEKTRTGKYGRPEKYVEGKLAETELGIQAGPEDVSGNNLDRVKPLEVVNKDVTGEPDDNVSPSLKQNINSHVLIESTKKGPTRKIHELEVSAREMELWKQTDATGEIQGKGPFPVDITNYFKGSYYNNFNYFQGDIYEKLGQLEIDRPEMTQAQYKKQKEGLLAVLPTPRKVDEIKITPLDSLAMNFKLDGESTLQELFLDYVDSLPHEAFKDSAAWEVTGYVNGRIVSGSDPVENALVRRRRREIGNELFNKFIREELPENQQKRLMELYNQHRNSIHAPDFSKVPLISSIHANFKGRALEMREIQKTGVGFLVNRGVGGFAWEVGGGKTLGAIVAVNELMQKGWIKKPLFVVPRGKLYNKWIEEIQELIPGVKINSLQNLGSKFKGDLKSLKIQDGTFSIITYEGAVKLGFSDKTMADLTADLQDVMTVPGAKTERAQALEGEKIKEVAGKAQKGTLAEISFEDLGFDHLVYDEAHRLKNIFQRAKAADTTKGERKKSNEFRNIQGTSSSRGVKAFLMTQYVLKKNKGRGVFLLTATPFTNNPIEYYSMMSLMAKKQLKKMGLTNVNDFMSAFMDLKATLVVKANNTIAQADVVEKFTNAQELRKLVADYWDFKDGDDLQVERPNKVRKKVMISANLLQRQYIQQADELFTDDEAGGILAAIGEIQNITISPYMSRYSKGAPPDAKTFVDNSPKIKATMESIRQIRADRPDTGLVIYMPRGIQYHSLLKDYLVNQIGYRNHEVGIISGETTKSASDMALTEELMQLFNDGKVKVIIGSDTIKEGIDLQKNTTEIFIMSLPYNPTDLMQIEGRGWRHGNHWMNIRIHYLLLKDTIDPFLMQKLETKERRIKDVREKTANEMDVSDINFEELKLDLITNPAIRMEAERDLAVGKLDAEIRDIEADKAMTERILKRADALREEIEYQKVTLASDKYKYTSSRIALIEKKIESLTQQLTTATEKMGKVNREQAQAKIKDLEKKLVPLNKNRDEVAAKYEARVEKAKKDYAAMDRKVTIEENDYQAIRDELKAENKTFFVKREAQAMKQIVPEGKKVVKKLPPLPLKAEPKVEQALSEGKRVPPEVLKDYPDLQKPAGGGGGSGAAMSAPSSKPQPEPGAEGEPSRMEGAQPPKNPIWPGAPNDFLPHIEMPELVRLARQLMGDLPVIRSLRRNLGYFKGARGENLAKLSLDRSIFKDPIEATKILAHEMGHLVDWLPNYTLARGNILGRLKSLQSYRKTLIDPLPSANDALDPVDRKKIQNNAIKEALSHTDYTLGNYIKSAEIRQSMKGMIKETYDDMIAAEIKRKKLVTREQVMAELKAVTRYWHPFDPTKDDKYTSYRYSAKELYAESLSMLFNEPLRLKEMAPTFYKIFWDNLEKKPEVQFNLLELDELLGTEQGRKQILEQRSVDIREGYVRGEKLWYQKRMERSIKKRNLWLTLKDELIDRNASLIAKVKEMKKAGRKLNPEDNPVYFLEEYNYLGGKIHNLLQDISKDVLEDTARFGISQEDLGEYLFLRRVVTERKDIANPLGQNRLTAQKSLDYLLSKFNDLQKKELDKAIGKLNEHVQKMNKEAFQAGLYSQETYDKIATNDAYATFQVLDYLQDYVSAAVIHQVGTFKEIANPLTSTIMKLISVKRAVEREKTRKMVLKFMQDNFSHEVSEAEYKFIGMRGEIPIREPREKEGTGILMTHDNGKSKHWYVDPYIADSVNYSPQSFVNPIIRMMRWFNSGWFRPIYINLNLGFQTFNFIRDFIRAWKLNPDVNFFGHIASYFRAMPAAYSRVWGEHPDKIIRDMREAGMMSITYNDMFKGSEGEESQIEHLMRKYGVGPMMGKEKRNPFMALMDVISDLGDFVETLPKVAGAQSRISAGRIKMKQIAHEVRVYSGSPDFLRKGRGYSWYNEVFLFSNAVKEGMRGDFEGAFQNPRTRTGYWWRTTASNLLPKLIMFLGALGFMGKKIKDNYDRQTEYDKTSYITIPLGMTDNGQAVYFRFPQDEVGRMIGAIFWKMLNAKKDMLDAAVQVFGLTAGQVPSQAPILDVAQTVTQYMIGRNPYDWFRGRPILTDDEAKVRGIPGALKMGRWVLDKSGFNMSWGYFDKPGDSWVVKASRYTPVISRFFKVTDYGLVEQKKANKEAHVERQAERRIVRRSNRPARSERVLVP